MVLKFLIQRKTAVPPSSLALSFRNASLVNTFGPGMSVKPPLRRALSESVVHDVWNDKSSLGDGWTFIHTKSNPDSTTGVGALFEDVRRQRRHIKRRRSVHWAHRLNSGGSGLRGKPRTAASVAVLSSGSMVCDTFVYLIVCFILVVCLRVSSLLFEHLYYLSMSPHVLPLFSLNPTWSAAAATS